jgi:hypothetical protein
LPGERNRIRPPRSPIPQIRTVRRLSPHPRRISIWLCPDLLAGGTVSAFSVLLDTPVATDGEGDEGVPFLPDSIPIHQIRIHAGDREGEGMAAFWEVERGVGDVGVRRRGEMGKEGRDGGEGMRREVIEVPDCIFRIP